MPTRKLDFDLTIGEGMPFGAFFAKDRQFLPA